MRRLLTVTASCEHEEYFEQLADTLEGFLDVYEDLCNLKQVRLSHTFLASLLAVATRSTRSNLLKQSVNHVAVVDCCR